VGWVVLVLLVLRSFVCLFYLYKYINNNKYSAGTLRWGCISYNGARGCWLVSYLVS
jgi:hypothetical protein